MGRQALPDPNPLPWWWMKASKVARYRYKRNGLVPVRFRDRRCENCGTEYRSSAPYSKYCSESCSHSKAIERLSTEKYKAQWKAANRKRRLNKPGYRLSCNVRSMCRNALKKQSAKSSVTKYLGCSMDGFKDYLLSHKNAVSGGFTIENYGEEWEIDHIRPLASFDLSDEYQVAAAFHYSNCQPLSKTENRKKGSLPNGERHYHKEA